MLVPTCPPQIQRSHGLCSLLAIFAVCGVFACDGGDDGVADDTGTQTGSDTVNTSTTLADTADDNGDSPFPPGCTDGGPGLYARVIDADSILLSSIFLSADCEPPSETPDFPNCTFDDYYAVLTLPGLVSGTYSLDAGEISLVRTHVWDHDQNDEGCFCQPDFISDVAVTMGTVKLSTSSAEGFAHAVEFSGVEGEGTTSFLVKTGCP